MFNLETKGVHITRDVIFLCHLYCKKKTDVAKEVITVNLQEEMKSQKLLIIPPKRGRA